MQDPPKRNIRGEKTHSVEWQVDVGQVAMGVGLLAVAYILYRLVIATGDNAEGDGERHQEVIGN